MTEPEPRKPRTRSVAPRASILIESMRDIGYSLQTAVADLVDNSITAGARNIHLLADTVSPDPAIGLLDDGIGMNEDELLEAMRPGSRNPRIRRDSRDLGRFGLGLKSASFSQCRRLTVLTRKDGQTSCACWDLDLVAERDEWVVLLPDDLSTVKWQDRLGEHGTLILWEKLDRLIEERNNDERRNLVRKLDETSNHLELIFHRFLTGSHGTAHLAMFMNGHPLEPFDPFMSEHPSTQFDPEEILRIHEQTIRIQPVTLPPRSRITDQEWEYIGGKGGHIRTQGFYVYRENRLIIHGTWFGLARQTPVTQLSRVSIEIPNALDSEWKIDIRKSSAQLPLIVRRRLQGIIDRIVAGSKRSYTNSGKKLPSGTAQPIWARFHDGERIRYGLDLEHPVFAGFSSSLTPAMRAKFRALMNLASTSFPLESLFNDMNSFPDAVQDAGIGDAGFVQRVRTTIDELLKSGISDDEIRIVLTSCEPFLSRREQCLEILEQIQGEK